MIILMEGVRVYYDADTFTQAAFLHSEDDGPLVIRNAVHDVDIDLIDLLSWLAKNKEALSKFPQVREAIEQNHS